MRPDAPAAHSGLRLHRLHRPQDREQRLLHLLDLGAQLGGQITLHLADELATEHVAHMRGELRHRRRRATALLPGGSPLLRRPRGICRLEIARRAAARRAAARRAAALASRLHLISQPANLRLQLGHPSSGRRLGRTGQLDGSGGLVERRSVKRGLVEGRLVQDGGGSDRRWPSAHGRACGLLRLLGRCQGLQPIPLAQKVELRRALGCRALGCRALGAGRRRVGTLVVAFLVRRYRRAWQPAQRIAGCEA